MRIVLSILLLFLFSCNKNSDDALCESNNTIIGKWQAYEQFRSPGVGGSWFPLANNERFELSFNSDNSFSYSSTFPARFFYDTFVAISSSVRVTSSVTGKSDEWSYSLESGCVLILNVFTCFEGCAYKLRRIQ